jgi:hypothetical protein
MPLRNEDDVAIARPGRTMRACGQNKNQNCGNRSNRHKPCYKRGTVAAFYFRMELKSAPGSFKRHLGIDLLVICMAIFVLFAGRSSLASSCSAAIALPKASEALVEDVVRSFETMHIYDSYGLSADTKEYLARVENPRMRKTLEGINGRMLDRKAWSVYFDQLLREGFQRMLKSENPIDRAMAGRGLLKRSVLLEILNERAEARGLSVGVVKNLSSSDFRAVLWKGPFLDRGVGISDHGVDTHLVQLDFVASVVEAELDGDFELFHRFLGSNKGIDLWTLIFDRNEGSTPHHPEYLGPKLRARMPFK